MFAGTAYLRIVADTLTKVVHLLVPPPVCFGDAY